MQVYSGSSGYHSLTSHLPCKPVMRQFLCTSWLRWAQGPLPCPPESRANFCGPTECLDSASATRDPGTVIPGTSGFHVAHSGTWGRAPGTWLLEVAFHHCAGRELAPGIAWWRPCDSADRLSRAWPPSPACLLGILEFSSSLMGFFPFSLQSLFPDHDNLQLILLILITPN